MHLCEQNTVLVYTFGIHINLQCSEYMYSMVSPTNTTHTNIYTQTHTHTHTQVQCYTPLCQLHFDFGDFNNGVCPALKVTAKSNPNMGTMNTTTILLYSPGALARGNRMPVMTMSVAHDWGPEQQRNQHEDNKSKPPEVECYGLWVLYSSHGSK